MATDSADQLTTSDRTERLAQIIDDIETGGTQVADYHTKVSYDDTLKATIEVEIDEGRRPEDISPWVEDAEISIGWELPEEDLEDADVDGDELKGDHSEAVADAAATPETADQESVDVPAESDVTPADLEDDTDEQDDDPSPDGLAGEILATLRDQGELAGPEIKTVTGASSDMYTAIGVLEDEGLIEKRKDPNDGRRTLYRPAEMDVDDDEAEPEWNGRDPEAIVADSSLPARVVLEDVLDAAASADLVTDAAETLDVDVDNLESVCWQLTLKQPDSLEIVDNVDERTETVREVVDGE